MAKRKPSTRDPEPHYLKWSKAKRLTSIFTGMLEQIFFCGLINGWNNLQFVYQQSCYFLGDNDDQVIVKDQKSGNFELVDRNNTVGIEIGRDGSYFQFNCSVNQLTFSRIPEYDSDISPPISSPQLTNLTKTVRDHQQYQLARVNCVALQIFLLTAPIWGYIQDNLLKMRTFRMIVNSMIVIGFALASIVSGQGPLKRCHRRQKIPLLSQNRGQNK